MTEKQTQAENKKVPFKIAGLFKKKKKSYSLRQKQKLKATRKGQNKTGKQASSSVSQCLVNREMLERISEM